MPQKILAQEKEAIESARQYAQENKVEQGIDYLLAFYSRYYTAGAQITKESIEDLAHRGKEEYSTYFAEVLQQVIPKLKKELQENGQGQIRTEEVSIFYALAEMYETSACKRLTEEDLEGSLRCMRRSLAYYALSQSIGHKKDSCFAAKRSLQQRIEAAEIYHSSQPLKDHENYEKYAENLQRALFGLFCPKKEMEHYLFQKFCNLVEEVPEELKEGIQTELNITKQIMDFASDNIGLVHAGLKNIFDEIGTELSEKKETLRRAQKKESKQEARPAINALELEKKSLLIEIRIQEEAAGLVGKINERKKEIISRTRAYEKRVDQDREIEAYEKRVEELLPDPNIRTEYWQRHQEIDALSGIISQKRARRDDTSAERTEIHQLVLELERMLPSLKLREELIDIPEEVRKIKEERVRNQRQYLEQIPQYQEEIDANKVKLEELKPERFYERETRNKSHRKYVGAVRDIRIDIAKTLRSVFQMREKGRYTKLHDELFPLGKYSKEWQRFCMGYFIGLEKEIAASQFAQKDDLLRRINNSYKLMDFSFLDL